VTSFEYRRLSFDEDMTLPQWTKEEAEELIRKWSN